MNPLPHNPPAPKAMAPFVGYETGPDGVEHEVPLSYNPNTGKYEKAEVPAGLRVGARQGIVPKNTIKPPQVTSKTWAEWLRAKAAINTPDGALNKASQDLATTQAKQVISESSRDPLVKGFLAAAWDHPDARNQSADIIYSKRKSTSPTLTPTQLAEAREIWDKLKSNQ